jgi:serine/threonine-protein kinase RsbW
LEERFKTDTDKAKELLDRYLSELSKHGWDEQEVFGVHLAAEEALMNALKHGNQLDAEKWVFVNLFISEMATRIEIEDEGGGFEPADVPDPTDDENLEIPSGRGLMLMRSFMSNVEFNDRGNRVAMFKDKNDKPSFDDDDDDIYGDD